MTEKGPVSWVCFKTILSASMFTGYQKSPEMRERKKEGRDIAGDKAPAFQKPECEYEAGIDTMRY